MKQLPSKFSWMDKEKAPCMFVEGRKHYGTLEHPGSANNPNIMAWAREVGVSGLYKSDDVPWCGLFIAVLAKRCGYTPPPISVRAKQWLEFGQEIPKDKAAWWDILVFTRPGGGHVGLYCGENDHAYLVYGGNQQNAVGFAWIAKDRCIGVRRPKWKIGQPANIRKIYLTFDGKLSENEA